MASTVDHVVDGIVYPASDGLPMGETPAHVENIGLSVNALQAHFANEPQIFIAGNMFIYDEEGNPRKHVSPDVFVSRGVPRQNEPLRNSYLVWMEGKMVDVVIELTSISTARTDLGKKKKLYERLGVKEYFLFDPHEEKLNPSMQGYRLVDGRFVEIEPVDGRLPSEVLGLDLDRDGATLRYFEPQTESWLPTDKEKYLAAEEKYLAAEEKYLHERQARARLEHKSEQTEAELASLRQRIEELEKRASGETENDD